MALFEKVSPEKSGAGESAEMAQKNMTWGRADSAPITQRSSISIGDKNVSKHDVDRRISAEKPSDPVQSPGQVLFVAVEIAADFSLCFGKSAIDGVVHAGVFFHKQFQPIIRCV